MELINRTIQSRIEEYFVPGKVIVLLGPRRVGKTVLVRQIISSITEPVLFLNGEDINTRELLARRSVPHYLQLLDGRKILIIDEAQKIPDVGAALKLMIDEIAGLRVLITGSSAFDVENRTGEPLTGRKYTFRLYPLSDAEYDQKYSLPERKDKMKERLIYGCYPELLTMSNSGMKAAYLNDLVSSYLLKDILVFENIKKSDKILSLLRLIAFQTGSEISTTEIGRQLGMSENTVSQYLDLLSKVFIIHKVGGFSRNLRKEISKSSKWYFFDNGIRNILVANLNPVELRNDVGQLWENYIISERIKFQQYSGMIVNNFFWRTYDQQEIDWVEERGGQLHAFEFKWSENKHPKAPIGWSKTYPDASYSVVNPDNCQPWTR
ncbi:MAG: ATP-binding protein [Bacteroidota bacterium]|jgi:predicted AAA+ superfamily ATPase|nr:ATP-binding protein [Saprospiraceae bacterium]